jgi:type VI secretion system protein VasD
MSAAGASTTRIRATWCAWMTACGMTLAGCGSPPKPPPPTVVTGSIEAAPQLNPTAAKRPSPVQVRIYELKSAAAFGSADFMSLYQGDQAALGPEMIAREEFTLRPGETRAYTKTLDGDTRFIGVVAAYRDLERATWRTVVPVQLNRTQKLTIRAGELAVSATVAP